MITEPRIILEGISIDDFFARLEKFQRSPEPQQIDNENMTVDEASAFLKLSTPTIHRLKAANKIPFVKVGARTIYRKSQLLAWMDSMSDPKKGLKR